jgi:hypothetical protein
MMFASSSAGPAVAETGLVGQSVTVLPLSGVRSDADVSYSTPLVLAQPSLGQPLARDGAITSIQAFSSLTDSVSFPVSEVRQFVSLWQADATSNEYMPIPGAEVELTPELIGSAPSGEVATGSETELFIPVQAGTKIIAVYSTTMSPPGLSTVEALVSLSVTIQ